MADYWPLFFTCARRGLCNLDWISVGKGCRVRSGAGVKLAVDIEVDSFGLMLEGDCDVVPCAPKQLSGAPKTVSSSTQPSK